MSRKAYKLDQLGFVGRGRSRHRPRDDASLYGGAYPFFQTGDVKAAEFYLHSYSQTYNEKGLAQSKLWQPGTLCITIAANIAETSILAIPGCFPDSIVGFIADPKKAVTAFVKYYLDTIKISMQNVSKGTTQDNLSLDKLLTFDLMVPNIPTQRRIASILSAYDDLIENNTRRIAILEEMARRLYEEWFVHFRFPGHENVQMVESELGPVPEGWDTGAFTRLAQVLSGGTPKKSNESYWNGSIPFFTPKDSPAASYVLETESYITKDGLCSCNSRLYSKDTVFITARGTVGKTALASEGMAMNQSCYALSPQEGYSPFFLFHATREAVKKLKIRAHGAVFDTIIVDTFKQMHVVIPPINVAQCFENSVKPMFDTILNFQRQNANLRAQRDLLLPKLISGEIDVSEAEDTLEEIAV